MQKGPNVKITVFVLNRTGFVLNMIGFVLSITDFFLNTAGFGQTKVMQKYLGDYHVHLPCSARSNSALENNTAFSQRN